MFMTLAASSVGAQSLKLGPQVGYQKAGDADDGKLMYGAALRLKLTPALGVEGSINYRQEKYADGALTVRSWPVMASALLYPLPFIHGVMGAGWYNTTLDYNENRLGLVQVKDETTQKFGWHFGGGAELPIGGKSKLAADIRYVFLNYDFNALPGSRELKSDFYVASIGLLWGL
jgi:opacity protein-like surface antigen